MTAPEGPGQPPESLVRGYRLLLLAYPRDFRRQHGDELLDTLLEAAPAGRRRPTGRETANLLRHGLRRHLGRPRSPRIVLVAVLFALVTGALGGVCGVWASWSAARDLPGPAATAAITGAVMPGQTPLHQSRVEEPFFYDDPTDASTILYGADDYSPGRLHFLYPATPESENRAGFARTVGDRLRASGWQVTGVRHDGWGVVVWAEKDGLLVNVSDTTNGCGCVDLTIVRGTRWWMWPAGVAGALAGALAGWLLLGWLSRRIHGRPLRQAAVNLCGLVFGFAILPALMLCGLAVVTAAVRSGPGRPEPLWLGLVYVGRFPAIVAAGALLCAVALAALPHRRITDRATSRPGNAT
ncbi:hypothetical protein [Longispora urticae]